MFLLRLEARIRGKKKREDTRIDFLSSLGCCESITLSVMLMSYVIYHLVVLGYYFIVQILCDIICSLRVAGLFSKGVVDIHLCTCIQICVGMLEHSIV